MFRVLYALKSQSEDILSLLDDYQVDIFNDYQSRQLLEDLISKNNYILILLEEEIDYIYEIKAIDPRVEIILFGNDETDPIEAIKKGASAYFSLPVKELHPIKETIEGIRNNFVIRKETAELERQLNCKYTFAGVIGKNPKILEIFNFMRRIAPFFKTAIIMGETGTGKEVIAKALHSLTPSAKYPFITCNCGALGENLVESEMFGHKKGSFTGAIADKKGLFEAAGEGTIFLDEIGDLPLSVQPHLLRVSQNGEFRPIGSHNVLKAKCRIIAASNKDLSVEVRKGRFREDLFYRLTPLTITLPPLRERKDDIPLLCRHFLDKFANRTGKKVFGISRPAQSALFSYDWPGNVRELENIIEQAAILTKESFIGMEDIPVQIRERPHQEKNVEEFSLDEIIKSHIEEVLNDCGWNRSKAAAKLKISRRALIRKIQKYSLN